MRHAGRRIWSSALIALVLASLAALGLGAGVFHGLQLRLTDTLFPAVAADPRIAVVGFDDRSLSEVQRWPWDRDLHARLIDALAADGAALVGYDVTFSEPSEPEDDRELGRAIREAGNVVLGATATFEGRGERVLRAARFEPPVPAIAEGAAAVAHVNVIPDPGDGVVRSIPLVVETPDGELVPSLSFALYLLEGRAGGPITFRPEGIQAGGTLVPTGRQANLDVNFAEGFDVYPAVDVLEGNIPPGTFRDRIVLVGATAIGLGDIKITPLDKASGQPGVLVHANALSTVRNAAYLTPLGRAPSVALVFLLALLVALAVAFLGVWLSPIVTAGIGVGYAMLAFQRFDRGQVLNLVYPAIAIVLAYLAALAFRYLTEVRERRRVTRTFTRYLAGDVVEEVLASPEEAFATLQGVERPISVLFADLRGFTSASEGATPREVVAALNVYLDAMTQAVMAEGGTIDKFMGDCVMAFWNAPREDPEHADKAVRAAVGMLDRIDRAVVEKEEARLLQVKGCGVGVATGEAVVGNIGSSERLDYTVVGDTVNTASRLCGVAAAGQVVVTAETARQVEGKVRLADLPPLAVKGKREPLRVFQVLREGQEAQAFEEGAVLDATEDKGHFETPVEAPPKAAGYTPVEPRPEQPPQA